MKPFLLAVLPALALTACNGTQPAIPGAQTPLVLQQTQEIFEFLPGRSDIAAEITDAKITGVAGKFILNNKTHVLTVVFKAGFAATNGPANNSAPVTLPYFVAVTQGDNIISKTDYSITLNFDKNATTANATSDAVKLKFSNLDQDPPVQVLVGFEMTPDQLAYTSAHGGTP